MLYAHPKYSNWDGFVSFCVVVRTCSGSAVGINPTFNFTKASCTPVAFKFLKGHPYDGGPNDMGSELLLYSKQIDKFYYVKKYNKKDGIIVYTCKEHLTCPFKVKAKRHSDGSWHISADSLNTTHICELKHSDRLRAVKVVVS
jgi:hypothetical protein